jgi:hypothetical protein
MYNKSISILTRGIRLKQLFSKVFFTGIFIILGAASLTVAALAMGIGNGGPLPKDRVVIEAGDEIPDVWAFLIYDNIDKERNNAGFITDMSQFSVTQPVLGEFTVEFTYNRKVFSSVLQIADTVPPRGMFVNRLSVIGENVPPELFARDISDATNVTVSYYNTVDFYTAGEQTVWISLRDEGGNETLLAGFVYIINGNRTIHREFGYPIEEILLEHFIFNEIERIGSVFITDIDNIDFSEIGVYPVDVWVMGRSETFYINVADTTPPVAEAVHVTAYTGLPVEASAFVTNIYDKSDVTVYFAEEPDWNAPGYYIVEIVLEDAAGNIGLAESTLNIAKDTEPPVFHGLRTLYVTVGGTVAYRPGVSAIDARDGAVGFTVDASGVDTSAEGTYYAYYEASDLSGNAARASVQVVVTAVDSDMVIALAQGVLDGIITEGMSDYEKGEAVYRWVKLNIGYTSQSTKTDIISGAYEGLTRRSGDCYTYYSTSKLMLDMLGIPNITLEREGGRTRHWWSLIDAGYGWHHFDATPHVRGGSGYHFTAERARQFTNDRGGVYYVFDPEKLPEGVIIR